MSTGKYGRYSYYETVGINAPAPTASSAYQHLPALDTPHPKKIQAFDTANESDNDGSSSPVTPTVKSATMEIQTKVFTGDKTWDGGGSYPSGFHMKQFLDHYFGVNGLSTFVGTTVASGGPGVATPVTLTSATNLTVGSALMFYPAAGGAPEVRFVVSINGAAVTLDAELATAANYAAGATVAAGFNYESVLGEYANYLYVNCEFGAYADLIGPLRPTSLKLQGLSAKQGLRWAIGLAASNFAAGWTPTYNDGVYVYSAYGATPCLVAKGAPVALDDVDTNVLELSVDFGCKNEEMPVTGGTNGVGGWFNTEHLEPTIEFTEYFNATRHTKYQAGTSMELRISVPVSATETSAKGCVSIYMPAAQVTVEDVTVGGQLAQKVKAIGRRPTAVQKVAGLDKPLFMTVFGGV